MNLEATNISLVQISLESTPDVIAQYTNNIFIQISEKWTKQKDHLLTRRCGQKKKQEFCVDYYGDITFLNLSTVIKKQTENLS